LATAEREAQLKKMFAAGWTTELFAEFWKAPDLKYIPSIITDDVVGFWPGERVVRGRDEYMRALEELLALLPDIRLEVKEHTMSADGEFGFTRWVMHATGANGAFELDGMDRTRVRDGLVCENYVFFDPAQFQRYVGDANMPAPESKGEVVRRFYAVVDAIAAGRTGPESVDEVATPAFTAHLPGSGPVDREGFKAVVSAFATGFPGATHTIETVVADGEWVAVRLTWRGTHEGVFQGATPTQTSIEMDETGFMRIENGKVGELWPLFDSLTLMTGIGAAMPASD
jgi:predicted ester cyclase/ketosteroid isomerase-like protein